jgi:alpha-1,6-mannosyltransferase
MIINGYNPYYVKMPVALIQDLPLGEDAISEKMMYGPLWALGYGIVMFIAGQQVWLGALLFKLLFAMAWVASLKLVWLMLGDWSLWHQSVGLLIFGWTPIGVMQGVAEGHNDVFVVFFVLLWLFFLQKKYLTRATLALAASVAVKYLTVPLFLLDFMHARYSVKQNFWRYVFSRAFIAGSVIVVAIGIFFRSFEFFSYFSITSTWHFYSPKEVIRAIEVLTGWNLHLTRAARSIFIWIGVYFVFRYWQRPNVEAFRKAVLAVMSMLLFSITSHIWPWYLLWTLGVAAIIPGASLTRWVVGVALVTPFPILMWIVYSNLHYTYVFEIPTLLYYLFAALWFVFSPRKWFPPTTPIKETEVAHRRMTEISKPV